MIFCALHILSDWVYLIYRAVILSDVDGPWDSCVLRALTLNEILIFNTWTQWYFTWCEAPVLVIETPVNISVKGETTTKKGMPITFSCVLFSNQFYIFWIWINSTATITKSISRFFTMYFTQILAAFFFIQNSKKVLSFAVKVVAVKSEHTKTKALLVSKSSITRKLQFYPLFILNLRPFSFDPICRYSNNCWRWFLIFFWIETCYFMTSLVFGITYCKLLFCHL